MTEHRYHTFMFEVTTHDHFNNIVKIGDTVGFLVRNSAVDRKSYEERVAKVVDIIFNSYYGNVPKVDIKETINGKEDWLIVLPDSIQKLSDSLPPIIDKSLPLVLPYDIYKEEMQSIINEK